MSFSHALIALALAAQGLVVDLPQKYQRPAPATDAVIATVDGKPILASELAPLLWDWRGDEALSDLISYRMAKQEADANGVKVTEEEIEAEMGAQIEQMRATLQPGQSVEVAIREQGFPRSRLYLRVASQLLVDKLVMRQFDPKEFVRVATIVVKPENEQAVSLSAALKLAGDAYDRLQKGETWDSVLASIPDPGGRPSGGSIGWRPLTAFPESVRQEMATLEAGKATKPVQTVNGIQIFRLEMHGKEAQGTDLVTLKEVYAGSARSAYAALLRQKIKVLKSLGGG